ncbi:cupin domain-containing protein [Sorangium sp. So ce381]|uniref:cupin domain-containing protein n=1 Tax=Sorangium sp. So ce381 TaxID=3133307 RepID=UPI003F5B1604
MSKRTLNKVTVIRREAIPTLRSVIVDGKEHGLGLHKDFRRDPVLSQFIPDNTRLSMAWVHLEPGETLDAHEHPIETMIVMCAGQGRMFGDVTTELLEGDVVAIPRGCAHGFVGAGTHGYWALSIQFEARGLYERPDDALVSFKDESASQYEELLRRNDRYMEEHKSNAIFRFVESERVNDAAQRGRLIDTIQVWSGYFQKVIMSRMVFGRDERYLALARQHFAGEYGHDENLAASRHGKGAPVWDPLLEACSAWFASKMLSIDDAEKTVLVHLVLEGAATVFHRVAHPIMAKFNETDHFAVHDLADDGHLEMGLEVLKGLSPAAYARCLRIQKEGWDMLNALTARMAELAEAAG